MEKAEEDDEEPPTQKSHCWDGNADDEMFINLLDQDKNNIYQYETKIACFGQKKFMLNPHDPEKYAIVISATLKT